MKTKEEKRAYQRQWMAANPDKVRATRKRNQATRQASEARWRKEIPGWAEKKRASVRASFQKYPARRLLRVARERAAKRGYEFSLIESDIQVPEKCPCCDVVLRQGTLNRKPHSPSLDRMDNTKGYIPSNVWVICWRCNSIKRDATVEDLLNIATALERRLYGHK